MKRVVNYFRKIITSLAVCSLALGVGSSVRSCSEDSSLEITTVLYPKNDPYFYNAKAADEIDFLVDKSNLESRFAKETQKKNNRPDNLAVLVSGYHEARDQLDLAFAYQVLIENGFSRNNIYILDRKGQERWQYPSDGYLSPDNLKKVMDHISKRADKQDFLFFYATGHGGVFTSWKSDCPNRSKFSSISTKNKDITEFQVSNLLKKVGAGIVFLLIDTCHAGGFLQRFSKGRYITVVSSKIDQCAYGTIESTFGRQFMESYRNRDQADWDKNGRVSIVEAFKYAKKNHTYKPLIKSDCKLPTPEIGAEFNIDDISLDRRDKK